MIPLIINLVGLIVVLAVLAGVVSQSIRIVREYQRIVLFRLGKCIGARGPGPIWLIPFVDRPIFANVIAIVTILFGVATSWRRCNPWRTVAWSR